VATGTGGIGTEQGHLCPITYQPVDGAALIEILAGAVVPTPGAEFAAALDANIAAGLLGETSGDPSRLIGRPTTPFKEGLRTALGG
jgi:NAD(P)H dehydrogenase (quinone)